MSDCTLIRGDLDAYRDDQLEEHRRIEVHDHLQHCNDCQQAAERATAIEQELGNQASQWTPSQNLWPRIKHSAELERSSNPVSRRRFYQHRWAVAALLVVTLGVASFTLIGNLHQSDSNRIAAALVNEFHTFVVSHRELDYLDSQPAEIRHWFGDKVNFRVPLPIQAADLQLAGGRLCNMFDQRIASFMYRVDDVWVSLYIMGSKPHRAVAVDNEWLLQGYAYIDWENQGLHYSLVGGVPLDRLRQIASSLRSAQLLARWQTFQPAWPINFKVQNLRIRTNGGNNA